MKNQLFNSCTLALALVWSTVVQAQQDVSLEQIRWKSEAQVRALLGDPQSIKGPMGTHAAYTLWKYEKITIAFANERAFHLFDNNSLRQTREEEG